MTRVSTTETCGVGQRVRLTIIPPGLKELGAKLGTDYTVESVELTTYHTPPRHIGCRDEFGARDDYSCYMNGCDEEEAGVQVQLITLEEFPEKTIPSYWLDLPHEERND